MRLSHMKRLALSCAAVLLCAAPSSAQTLEEAEREEDYIRVVQTEAFPHRGRFAASPTFGLSINDPLVQQFYVGVNLDYFFSESVAFLAQFHYAFDARRASQNALLANQLRPEVNPTKWVGTGGVEWVPLYGKFALFNGPIVYWDAYLTAGAGVTNTERAGSLFTGTLGVGSRFRLARWLTLLVEFRDYLFHESLATSAGERGNLVNNVVFSIGLGFFTPPRGG
jgi:outer membrane beta-barrel protein